MLKLSTIYCSIMLNWEDTFKRSEEHKLFRCKQLAASHNPDYVLRHANECKEFAKNQDGECKRRLKHEFDIRMKNAFQIVQGATLKRYNRNV